jgi:hypothetical protein
MTKLPSPETLAAVVSNVTESLCGFAFVPGEPFAASEPVRGRMFIVPFDGDRQISVLLSCDRAGSQALVAALSQVNPDTVSDEMAGNAIRELLNLIAGRLHRTLEFAAPTALRQATLVTIPDLERPDNAEAILLRSTGAIDARLWIIERAPEIGA